MAEEIVNKHIIFEFVYEKKAHTENAPKMGKWKILKSGFVMTQPDPNDALSQNVMMLGLLVASENANTQTNKQDSY